MASQQGPLAPLQGGAALVAFRQAGQLALHPDEFAALVAALLQPVGVDQPQVLTVGLGQDRFQELVGLSHRRHPW
jgi:hypothetical protein